MKYFSWDADKNELLKRGRKISFDEVVFYIENGGILETTDNPNQEKYKGQRMFIVNIGGYVYLVPFIEKGEEVILKTIIPSRKATKTYLRGDANG